MGGNRFKIATGGDDCGVYVSEFELAENSVTFLKTSNSHSAHIAQITGIKFTSPNVIYTVGIDQRICRLHVHDEIEVVERKYTSVADVKGFAFYDDFIFIHGAGLEVIRKF